MFVEEISISLFENAYKDSSVLLQNTSPVKMLKITNNIYENKLTGHYIKLLLQTK